MNDKNNKLSKILSGFPQKVRENPRVVISKFFCAYDLGEHLWYIDTWMDSVNANDYWKENDPSFLFFYYEDLNEMINATYIISKEEKRHKTALDILREKGLDDERNLLHPALYFGWQQYGTMWDFFPRSLSKEEFINPYLVLRKFFKFQSLEKWHQTLHDLLADSFSSRRTPADPMEGIDLSYIRKNLHKLIEAAHLIDVREMDKIAGKYPKKEIYTLEVPYPEVLLRDKM